MADSNNNIVDDKIVESLVNSSIEDFYPYLQRLIESFEYDIKNNDDMFQLAFCCKNSLFLYYFADCQLTVMKHHYEKKHRRSFTDEELLDIVKTTKLSFLLNHFPFSVNDLSSYERSRIYNDFAMLQFLYDRKILAEYSMILYVMEQVQKFEFKALRDRYSAFYNLKNKIKYDEMGLEEYVNNVMPQILSVSSSFSDEHGSLSLYLRSDRNEK